MTAKGFLDLLRKHGTANTVSAVLSIDCSGNHLETLKKQGIFLASLTAELERQKILRRGKIVNLLCVVSDIKEEENEAADD